MLLKEKVHFEVAKKQDHFGLNVVEIHPRRYMEIEDGKQQSSDKIELTAKVFGRYIRVVAVDHEDSGEPILSNNYNQCLSIDISIY